MMSWHDYVIVFHIFFWFGTCFCHRDNVSTKRRCDAVIDKKPANALLSPVYNGRLCAVNVYPATWVTFCGLTSSHQRQTDRHTDNQSDREIDKKAAIPCRPVLKVVVSAVSRFVRSVAGRGMQMTWIAYNSWDHSVLYVRKFPGRISLIRSGIPEHLNRYLLFAGPVCRMLRQRL